LRWIWSFSAIGLWTCSVIVVWRRNCWFNFVGSQVWLRKSFCREFFFIVLDFSTVVFQFSVLKDAGADSPGVLFRTHRQDAAPGSPRNSVASPSARSVLCLSYDHPEPKHWPTVRLCFYRDS
jgi:hypothetical protein